MQRLVFISYAPEDRKHQDRLVQWAKEGRFGADWMASVPSGSEGPRQQESTLRATLSVHLTGAAAMILLVGDGTHKIESINNELNHAITQNKRLLLVRVPGSSGPAPRVAQGRPFCAFNPEAIRAALEGRG